MIYFQLCFKLIGLIINRQDQYKTFFQIRSVRLRLMSDKNLLHDKKFYLVFDRVLLLRPIFFFFFNIHLRILQMVILYMTARNAKSLVKPIESIVYRTFNQFSNNQLKENGHKCHAFLITKEKVLTNVNSAKIGNSQCQKLSAVIIDNKLRFEGHIKTLEKHDQKLVHCPWQRLL